MYSNTTIVIPTFNEEKNIQILIDEIEKLYPGVHIIISDDGSKDKTRQIIGKTKAILIDREKEQIHGLTASVIDAAKEVKTENMIIIDGDFQHPPDKIKKIVQALEKCHLVICARKKVVGNWPLPRKMMSFCATLLAKFRLMRNIKDPLSGYFGIKTTLFQEILKKKESKYQKEGYKVLFDTLKYLPRNTQIKYVYYKFGERRGGDSKIGKKHIVAFIKSIFTF